jgi:Protein of unknown function (DUF3298)
MRIPFVAALLAAGVVAGSTLIPAAAAQSPCSDLQGMVGPEGNCRVHVQNAAYTLDMTFPNDYPDARAVIDYLKQSRDGFVNVANDPDAYNLPYELDAEGAGYRSGPPTGGTRSVVFSMWQNVGGAHPMTYYQTFNWNVDANAPITFETLFKPGTRPLDVIYPEVNKDLRKQGMNDAISPGEGLDVSNYKNFAITDDSVIFFFSQGGVFPEAAGPVQASVPRDVVAPMLAL